MSEVRYTAVNASERARLVALVVKLADEDLQRPVGHGWTVGATLAHLAYWEQRNLAALDAWEAGGTVTPTLDFDEINDQMLPEWLAASPADVQREAINAAAATDAKIDALAPELVQSILAVRPRTIIRAMHRREHLDEIERALAG